MELRRVKKTMRVQSANPAPVRSGQVGPDSIQSVAQGARTTS
jgi:hypothetical protein